MKKPAPSATARTARARPRWARNSASRISPTRRSRLSFTDEAAFKAIKEGLKDKEGKTQMKAAEGLSDDDIKALVKHVRSFKK